MPLPPTPPPTPLFLPCRVCTAPSPRFTVVDFAKHCSHTPWLTAHPIGVPVIYHRCPACKLIFTPFFDTWTPQDFAAHIYNDAYAQVDPEYLEARPHNMANLIANSFPPHPTHPLKILDYGGGNGATATFLRQKGYTDVSVYEPFNPTFATRPPYATPADAADLLLCIEVLEHAPHPLTLLTDLASLLKPNGLIFLTTLLQPPEVAAAKGEHWYIAPRNGHTHFHSQASLSHAAKSLSLHLHHATQDLHVLFKSLPPWAASIFQSPPRTETHPPLS